MSISIPTNLTPEYLGKINKFSILRLLKEAGSVHKNNKFVHCIWPKETPANIKAFISQERMIEKFDTLSDALVRTESTDKQYSKFVREYQSCILKLRSYCMNYKNPDLLSAIAASIYYTIGDAKESQELYDKTIAMLNDIITNPSDKILQAIARTDLMGYLACKVAIGLLENDRNAQKTFNTLLAITPQNEKEEEAYINIAEHFGMIHALNLAIKMYEKVYKQNPTKDLTIKLAETYFENQQYNKAEALYVKLLHSPSIDKKAFSDFMLKWIDCRDKTNLDLSIINNEIEKLDHKSLEYYKFSAIINIVNNNFDKGFDFLKQGAIAGFKKELANVTLYAYQRKIDSEQPKQLSTNTDIMQLLQYIDNNRGQLDKNSMFVEAKLNSQLHNYHRAWQIFEDYIKQNNYLDMKKSFTDPLTYDQLIIATTALLNSFGEDLVNIENRGAQDLYHQICADYKEKISLLEIPILRIVTLNKSTQKAPLELLENAKNVFSPMVNPNYFAHTNIYPELNFDTLMMVFDKWKSLPYVKQNFTREELKQLQTDIKIAIEHKDDPDFSFAGCLVNLNTYVEKYTEPLFYFFATRVNHKHKAQGDVIYDEYEQIIKQFNDKKNKLPLVWKDDLLSEIDAIEKRLNLLLEKKDVYSKKLNDTNKKLQEKKINSEKRPPNTQGLEASIMRFEEIISETDQKITEIKKRLENKKAQYESAKDIIKELNQLDDKKKNLENALYIQSNKPKPNDLYNLGSLFKIMTIQVKQNDGTYKQIINPDFKEFVILNAKNIDTIKNPELFGLQLINNIEAYRYIRNQATHGDKNSRRPKNNDENFRNWDSIEETQTITKEQFLHALNIALFSKYSIFSSLKQLNIIEMHSAQNEEFFNSI